MLIERFNRAWEKERQAVALRLADILEKEIREIRRSLSELRGTDYGLELQRMLAGLLLRKALVEYESEEIVKRRMEMRLSYIAVVLSSAALIVSIFAAVYAGKS